MTFYAKSALSWGYAMRCHVAVMYHGAWHCARDFDCFSSWSSSTTRAELDTVFIFWLDLNKSCEYVMGYEKRYEGRRRVVGAIYPPSMCRIIWSKSLCNRTETIWELRTLTNLFRLCNIYKCPGIRTGFSSYTSLWTSYLLCHCQCSPWLVQGMRSAPIWTFDRVISWVAKSLSEFTCSLAARCKEPADMISHIWLKPESYLKLKFLKIDRPG